MVASETFLGYRRPDGTAGIRNLLAVIPSVVCANTVAQRVAALLPGAVAIPHPHGCAQVGDDVVLTEQVLAGAAANPNVGAALVIGLGCETCQASDVAEMARAMAPGKAIESFYIQDAGGSIKAIARGVEAGKQLMSHIAVQQRLPVPLDALVLATECGHADETTTAVSNATAARVAERALDLDGTVLVPEWLAGGGLAPRSHDNGARPVRGVLRFAERPAGRGLYAMSTPEQDAVSVSAMAAAGAQVCLFTTGRGSPIGNAICPVIKICGNAETNRSMEDNIDFSTAPAVEGATSPDHLSEALYRMLLEVCNGQLTNAEIIGHQEFALHRIGPTV